MNFVDREMWGWCKNQQKSLKFGLCAIFWHSNFQIKKEAWHRQNPLGRPASQKFFNYYFYQIENQNMLFEPDSKCFWSCWPAERLLTVSGPFHVSSLFPILISKLTFSSYCLLSDFYSVQGFFWIFKPLPFFRTIDILLNEPFKTIMYFWSLLEKPLRPSPLST